MARAEVSLFLLLSRLLLLLLSCTALQRSLAAGLLWPGLSSSLVYLTTSFSQVIVTPFFHLTMPIQKGGGKIAPGGLDSISFCQDS